MDHEGPDASAVVRLEACVRGRVQGVGYRAWVRDAARRLGVGGKVWNGADRAVYVLAEGPRPGLDALLQALAEGPPLAAPTGVEPQWRAAQGNLPRLFEVGG